MRGPARARRQSTREAERRVAVDSPAVSALVAAEDGRRRCRWGGSTPDYIAYHDEEWGRPVTDDRGIYERLVLEGFQSGLSWLTILRKREHFRAAFADFDIEAVARFGKRDVRRLLADAGIVRHRGKIEAAIANAKAAAALDVPLAELVWAHAPERAPPRAARAGRRAGGHARSPRRSPRSSSGAASASSARPPPTRRCRPAASSTTTWPAAGCGAEVERERRAAAKV